DFVLDTFERASGTWYGTRKLGRRRLPGRLDFSSYGIDNQRSVERFIDFAGEHPELFEVYQLAGEERIEFRERSKFFAHVYEHRDRYAPGDIVTILGLRDDDKYHYHSFFVFEADPVTGMPTRLAANAGRPRIRSWENELQNAPRRSLYARVRP